MHRSFETGVYLMKSRKHLCSSFRDLCKRFLCLWTRPFCIAAQNNPQRLCVIPNREYFPLTDNWSSYSLSSSLAYTAAYNATWSLSYYTCTQIVQSTTRIGVGGLWYVDKQKASSQCKYVGSCLSWKVHLHTCNLIISFVGIQIKNLCCSVEG